MSTDWCILGFYEFKVVLYCRREFMMSIDIFISIYISFISGSISTLVTEAAVYFLLVVFPFRGDNLGKNIYSDSIILYPFTRQFVTLFQSVILR